MLRKSYPSDFGEVTVKITKKLTNRDQPPFLWATVTHDHKKIQFRSETKLRDRYMEFDTLLSWKSRYVLFFNQNQKPSEVFSFHSIEFNFHKLKKAEKTPRYCLLNRKKGPVCIQLSENLSGLPVFSAWAWFTRQKTLSYSIFRKWKVRKEATLARYEPWFWS